MDKKNHGGFRLGAGRKCSYGEQTKPVRIPESQVSAVLKYLELYRQRKAQCDVSNKVLLEDVLPIAFESPKVTIPFMSSSISAGFPSPADDYVEHGIDLNEHLILHREATYILRVSGWSMVNAGIYDGDEIIVDRALDPKDNHVVVAVLDNQLTVKRLRKAGKSIRLVAENPEFPDILIGSDQELLIWGVVTRVLHKV